jgi:chitinase
MHIMNYDYFGSWDNKVGFNAPLKNNENELSVMFAIEYFLKMGAPANKLVMVNNIYK